VCRSRSRARRSRSTSSASLRITTRAGLCPLRRAHRGVHGRTVRVSHISCHYPSGAMLSSPSPPGVRGRTVRVSHISCHYPSGAMLSKFAEPTGRTRPGGTCQFQVVPLPERGYAFFAEPAGGKRPGGTCQSHFVPLPERGHALFAEPAGGKRPGGACQSVSPNLSGSRVRAGSALPGASAADRGSGQGQSWPRVTASQCRGPGLRVGRDGTRVAARGRARSWSRSGACFL
jgi:hypothetical protein